MILYYYKTIISSTICIVFITFIILVILVNAVDTTSTTTASSKSNTSDSSDSTNHDFKKDQFLTKSQQIIHEPRNEIYKSITSGEEAWLRSININRNNKHNNNNNNHEGNNPNLNSKTVWSNEEDRGKGKENNQKASSQKQQQRQFIHYNDNDSITEEFLQLSKQHDIYPTSSIDRSTMADLMNIVNSYEDDDKSSASSSTINNAYYYLGLFNLYGLGGVMNKEPNILKAFEYFRLGAENGHVESQCALGLLLYYGMDSYGKKNLGGSGTKGKIGIDKKSAMRWFYHASVDYNHPRGHWLLGKVIYEGMFYDDIGMTVDMNISKKNDTDNDESQQYDVDDEYKKKRNFVEATKLFHKAIESNDPIPEAYHQLAIMYEYNLIPDFTWTTSTTNNATITETMKKRDSNNDNERFEHAVNYYQKASELGYIESIYHLGLMYAYGRGVTLDSLKAIEYFRQGAMNLHGPSMRYLGIFAMKGYGGGNYRYNDNQSGFDFENNNEDMHMPNIKLAMYWFDQCKTHSKYISQVRRLCESELNEVKLIMDNIASYQSSS